MTGNDMIRETTGGPMAGWTHTPEAEEQLRTPARRIDPPSPYIQQQAEALPVLDLTAPSALIADPA